ARRIAAAIGKGRPPALTPDLDLYLESSPRKIFVAFEGVVHHMPPQGNDEAVPTANPKQLTGARESVDSPMDERFLQIDLVRLDRAVPVASCVGSRNPCPSASAQRAAAQIPEASSAQQHRPAVACRALSAVPRVLDALKIMSRRRCCAGTVPAS